MSSIDEHLTPPVPTRRRSRPAPSLGGDPPLAPTAGPQAAVDAGASRTFAVGADEPLGQGIVRVAGDQLDSAARRLDGPAGVSAKDVHEARKSLKRLRAVTRLLRPTLGVDAYRRENEALRDAARHLAGARDAEVMAATLDTVAPRSPDSTAPAEDFTALRAHLRAERERTGAQLDTDAGPAQRAAADLAPVRARVGTWLGADAGFEAIEPGLRRIYREARQRHRRARRRPTGEHLHEWRKRVKDLRYCTELLQPIDPQRLGELSAGADRLGEMLGDEHDLTVLAAYADAHPELFSTRAERRRLGSLVRRERVRLRRRAVKLGDELFDRRPRRFTARLAKTAAAPAPDVAPDASPPLAPSVTR